MSSLGCGTGALLNHVRKEAREPFAEMVGVDMIEPATPMGEGIKFVCNWVEDLRFADKSFDTVVCTHVIEHILDMRRAIAEVLAIPLAFLLRPGLREDFLPYELSAIAAVCGLILAFPLVVMPTGFVAAVIVAAMIARRATAGDPLLSPAALAKTAAAS